MTDITTVITTTPIISTLGGTVTVNGGDNDKVKVSANDTTSNYLLSKLTAGTGIDINETNDGGNESVTIVCDIDEALDSEITSNGLVTRTAALTYTARTITGPAAGISVADGDGVSGNPTLSLANDLAAVEGLGSTGIAVRSASDTWVQRSVAGTANEITATNGDGVSGNPTLSLPSALTFTGKTVTGGTFAGVKLSGDTELATASELTVATGAITATQNHHTLQPESGTTDTLDTINGLTAGQFAVFRATDNGTDTITFSHGTGNISCIGASNISLSEGAVLAISDGTTVYCIGGGGSSGGGVTALSVTDITDPSAELNAIDGSAKGDLRLCYQTVAGEDTWTLYAFDNADSGSEAVPYRVDGATGMWSAIAGAYVAQSTAWETPATVRSNLELLHEGVAMSFSTTTTDSDPGASTIRFDSATPASVTAIYIDDTPLYNTALDLGVVWGGLAGQRLLIKQKNDGTRFLLASVTGAVDATGYFRLHVTVDDSGTLPESGAILAVIPLPTPGVGNAVRVLTVTSHGMASGDRVYIDGANSVALCDASTAAGAEAAGTVIGAPDANTVVVQFDGPIRGGYSSLTAGAVQFLSETGTTGNTITETEPTTDGAITKPVGIALNTTEIVVVNMRGATIGSQYDAFGGLVGSEVSVTTTATLSTSNFGKSHALAATSADYTVTLPTAVGNTGKVYALRVTTATTYIITLATTSSQTLGDYKTSLMLLPGERIVVRSDGANWIVESWHQMPIICEADRSTAQTITNNTNTTLQLDNVVEDTTSDLGLTVGGWDAVTNYDYTVPVDGRYDVQGGGGISGLADGAAYGLRVEFTSGGSNLKQLAIFANGAADSAHLSGLTTFDLSKGDTIELQIFHQHGSNRDTLTGVRYNNIKIQCVDRK